MKFTEFVMLLIKNNNGYSVKSAAMVWGMCISTLVIVFYLGVLCIEAFTEYRFNISWTDFALILGAVSTLIGVAVYGKVKGDTWDTFNKDQNIE